ncbi:hypothetical protein GCM10010232_70350 [Streptomyces amakusaensis]
MARQPVRSGWEVCGRCGTETVIVEAGPVPVAAEVRTSLAAGIERTRHELPELGGSGRVGHGPAVPVLAHAALQAVEQPLPEYRTSPLGFTEEAETETHRAYRTEQNWLWYSTTRIARTPSPPPWARPGRSEGTHRAVSTGIRQHNLHTDGYGATRTRHHLPLIHQQNLGSAVKHVKENSMIT